MLRNIIVRQGRIELNGGKFNISKRDNPVKPPIWKTQQVELENSDLGETNFVGNMLTRDTPQRVKTLRTSGV
jgi:hypothetical protein